MLNVRANIATHFCLFHLLIVLGVRFSRCLQLRKLPVFLVLLRILTVQCEIDGLRLRREPEIQELLIKPFLSPRFCELYFRGSFLHQYTGLKLRVISDFE